MRAYSSITKEYDKAVVICKMVEYHPCALDRYEVLIERNGKIEYSELTFGGMFESDDDICDRIYQQWQNEGK